MSSNYRVVTIGPCTLIHADWRDWLSDDVEFTAIVTDPPYGIGYVKGNSGASSRPGGSVHRSAQRIIGDDEPFDPSPLLAYNKEFLSWGADKYHLRLPSNGRWLAWDKLAGRQPWDSFGDVDFAWHSVGGASRVFSMLWKGVACEKAGEDNGKRYHPTQKPVRLMSWCLSQLDDPSIVVDPYMGSGSTGVAVVRSGTGRFIGIEINESYFETAIDRIRRECEKQ